MLRALIDITICIVFFGHITSAFSTNEPSNFRIVTSFSLLKNWVDVLTKGIPSDRVVITHVTLVPCDVDPHAYQPTPMDSKALVYADVVIKLGLLFEGWLDPLIAASATKAECIVASDGITHRDQPAPDPHIWHDVQKARQIVRRVAMVLCRLLPSEVAIIQHNANVYDDKLALLEVWVRAEIGRIPVDKRKIITTHDAFYYYGAAYGVTFIAPVGLSTETEVDSKTLATIIRQIKDERITAVFFENLANRNVMRQIAEETGIAINEDATLYADSLVQKVGDCDAYEATIRHNTTLIVGALAPASCVKD